MSFQNVSTQGLRDVLGMLVQVQSSEQHDDLLNAFKAEIDKRERMTEGGQAQAKDEKWARLDEMPYGKYEGCKFSGIPVSYLETEKERLEGLKVLTDEEKKVLATVKHTLNWKASKDPISKMPFGKHKGQSFDDIPVGYLEWLLNNSRQPGGRPLDEDLENAVTASIERRSK